MPSNGAALPLLTYIPIQMSLWTGSSRSTIGSEVGVCRHNPMVRVIFSSGRTATILRMLLHVKLGALVMVAGSLCLFAQSPSPSRASRADLKGPPALPKACITQGHQSDKTTALIESLQDHP